MASHVVFGRFAWLGLECEGVFPKRKKFAAPWMDDMSETETARENENWGEMIFST